MTDIDYKGIKKIFSLNQNQLLNILSSTLKTKYGKQNIIKTKDYIIAKGSIPICLVAHLDTVFPFPPNIIYYDKEQNVMWSPEGLGADDRAGVFAILKILQRNYLPHIIFTTNEELGCVGTFALISKYKKNPFNKLKYIIELGRQGKKDSVYYECDNEKFKKYINNFGFIEKSGSFSDISVLGEAWGIAAVNLSIGYYNEHSHIETLNIHEMFLTINKVCEMLKQSKNAEYFNFIKRRKK